jgi:outer membrane biogenesis lipoprotein LolB
MSHHLIAKCLLAAVAVALLSGCLMRQTVTSNGDVVQDNYVVKRPLKDAIERSE